MGGAPDDRGDPGFVAQRRRRRRRLALSAARPASPWYCLVERARPRRRPPPRLGRRRRRPRRRQPRIAEDLSLDLGQQLAGLAGGVDECSSALVQGREAPAKQSSRQLREEMLIEREVVTGLQVCRRGFRVTVLEMPAGPVGRTPRLAFLLLLHAPQPYAAGPPRRRAQGRRLDSRSGGSINQNWPQRSELRSRPGGPRRWPRGRQSSDRPPPPLHRSRALGPPPLRPSPDPFLARAATPAGRQY